MVALEGAGIPSVMVASAEFIVAAQTQSDALGAAPKRVFVDHPIQDRTDDEMRALADAALDDVLSALTSEQ
jgi:hypothetical protein